MENCIEARALKSSVLSELAVKSTQQSLFLDELFSVNGINSVTSDEFSVDVFLNLSNGDLDNFFEEKDSLSSTSQDLVEDDNFNSTAFSGAGDYGSVSSAGELVVPVDDFEDLEWLSQFADDSVSELSLLCPAGDFKENISVNQGEPVCMTRPVIQRSPVRCFSSSVPVSELSLLCPAGDFKESISVNQGEPVRMSRPAIQRSPVLCFWSSVPVKTRSKRARPSGGGWYFRDSPSLSESSSTMSSSSGSSQTSVLCFSNPVGDLGGDGASKPPAKKKQKRPAAESGGEAGGFRRCSHCQVPKTPQWRAGPLGAKTLCNACGVRFKTGRLFPEYRPACSPTFSGDVHSNSHRKVLEMRRKKEEVTGVESGLTLVVPSF